jgi:protein phosphatase
MIRRFRLRVAGLTDTGLVRALNEDSLDWDAERGLALIADGMGGHNAGEVASRIASENVMTALRGISAPIDERQLATIINEASGVIYRQAQVQSGCEKMGTTLVVLYVERDRVYIAHVGDSRAYRLRDGQLTRLTEDHSLVRQMLDEGSISKEEARTSRYRNVITRALGVRQTCEPDVVTDDVSAGDVYLLCSDGLTNMVSDDDIRDILDGPQQDLQTVVATLTERAKAAGGDDNISVIVVAIVPEDEVGPTKI